MSREALIEFEKKADPLVESLPFWKLPIRATLTGLYALIDQLIHGPVDGRPDRRVLEGEAVVSRLSNLAPLLVNCPAEPIPSPQDSIELFNKANPDGSSGRELLAYAHFCELMPEARKQHYRIIRSQGRFDLEFPDEAFAETETKDVLLSELAIGFLKGNRPKVSLRCALLCGWLEVDRRVNAQLLIAIHVDVMQELYEFAYR